MLTETGTTIIKCFLHISKDEQRKRLQERLDDPAKTWKFNPGDIKERALWPNYTEAYEQAIKATSTKYAPWHIVPSDSKTNRNLLISRLLLSTLKDLDLRYPAVPAEYKSMKIQD
jgi:polyphosphate kinase 2 (PPK2 family)